MLRSMKHIALVALLLVVAGPTFAAKGGKPKPPPPPPPIVFSLTVLGGNYASQTVRMNDNGDVVGRAEDPDGKTFAAIWPSNSTLPADLNDLIDPSLGLTLLFAQAINNSGQIGGWMRDESGVDVTWSSYRLSFPNPDPPLLEDLGTPAFSIVNDVNEFGDVLVRFFDQTHVYTDELGLMPIGTTGLRGYAINNAGDVTGAFQEFGIWHSFLYSASNDSWVDLTPNTVGDSAAWDLNDNGEVVGYYGFQNGRRPHAFLWTPNDGIVDLGTLGGEYSNATSINDTGVIVGKSTEYKPRGNQPPAPVVQFLYIDGQMHKLWAEVVDGGLIANGELPSGWDQATPSGHPQINNVNQVCGQVALPDGSLRLFVLTPVVP